MSQFDNPYNAPPEVKPQFNTPGMPPPQSGLAVGSMIVGIISVALGPLGCCCGLLVIVSAPMGLAALVMGFMAKPDCDKGLKSGGGMALAGMICGGIALAFAILNVVFMALGIAANVGAQGLQPNGNF